MGARLTTRSTAVTAALALLLSTIGLITATPAQAATPSKTITTAGPLTKISVTGDLNCAVNHTGDTKGEFFTDTACGTFVAAGGWLHGPASLPGGPQDPGTANYRKFTSLSQTGVTGTGSASDPYKIVTVVNVGSTGLRLTQTDTYVTGQSSYRTDVALTNTGQAAVSAIIYRAGNCQLANDTSGFGAVDAGNGAISCVNAVQSGLSKVPGTRVEQWFPLSAGNKYSYNTAANIWSQLLSRQPLANVCGQCSTYQDNASAISWSLTVAPNETATRSNLLAFQPLNSTPLVTTKTADDSAVGPGAATGYTIKVTNPNTIGVTLTSITDDLPAGFSYRSGTSSGTTTADPVATNGGSHLTWSGQFSVPASGSTSLHFGANAASTPGDYFNRASAAATAPATVTPSGDTAKITVVGPASLSISADRGTTPASPSSLAAGDLPMQRTSPKVQSSPIMGLPLLSSGIVGIPLLSSPIMGLPLLSSPIMGLPLLSSGIMGLPLLSSPFGLDSLSSATDLGSSPAVKAGLDRISLASLEIVSGDPWTVRLAGSSIADQPLASLTLADLFAAGIGPDKMPTFAQLNLSGSPLGALSSVALFMGDTRLKFIGGSGFNWCTKLEGLGFPNCGASLGVAGSPDRGLSASLLSLQISGVDLDAIDGLKAVQLKDVTFPAAGEAVLPAILLSSFDLYSSSIGGLLVKSVPNPSSVFDCTKIDCTATSTKNIYNASQAGALRADAKIGSLGTAAGDLTIHEAVLGTYGTDSFNPYDLPAEQLDVLGLGTAEVKYSTSFRNQFPLANGEVEITLPAQFRYVPGSGVVKLDGAPLSGVALTVADETLTWDLGTQTIAPGRTLTIDLTSRPGLLTGALNASVVVRGDNFSLNAATATPIGVTENFESGDTEASAASVQSGQMEFAHLGHPGDVDYYSIPAPAPGSTINAYLTCGGCDADLTVYHPTTARQHNPMRPASDAPEVRPELDHSASLSSSGEPLVPLALQDMPIINRPVAGISSNRNFDSEGVRARAWDAPGANYLIQVSGYNGATGLYTLRITVTPPMGAPPVGNARVFPHDGDATYDTPAVPASFAGTKSLVLAHRTRLRRAYGDARAQVALDALDRLANTAGLGVKVLFLDGFSEIPWANLDARPSDPERSNDVVRAINARVDSLLGADRAGLQHIVLAGTDEILPMGRIPDFSAIANEQDFAQELKALAASTGGNNALLGASAASYLTTDDPYCSFAPRGFLGSFLYIPNVACGRLVESPEDMAQVINQFLTPTQSGDAPGVLRPAKSLSVGADFMTNLADEIKTTLNNELTPGQVTSLINGTWKRSDLQTAFPDALPVPDIVGLQAHFNPNVLLPANASEGLFTTAAFGNSTPAQVAKRIVATMGCHSGFSISNYLSSNGSAPDWAETMLGKGVAAFVGNTSYGIGVREVVAFSAKVMSDFVGNIAEMPLGTALAQAKRDYLGGAVPNLYDYKVMAQATFYGLPMFRVAGAGDGPQPPPAPRPTTIDPATGLVAADITVSNPNDSRWQLVDTGQGKLWKLAGGKHLVERDRPFQPTVTVDVNQPGLEPRSASLTALESISDSNFDPAMARTLVGGESDRELQRGDTIFPTALPSLGGDKLSLAVAQFQSGPNGTGLGTETRFTKIGTRVVYAPKGSPRAIPVFTGMSATKNGSTGSFRVNVTAPGGSIRDVTIVYNDGTSPTWIVRRLALSADGSHVGGFPISSSRIQWIAQAVSNTGDGAITTNKGDLFDFISQPTGVTPIDAEVTPFESNGWYPNGATLVLNGAGVDTFAVSDNNGPVSTWSSGQPIPVTGSGVHTLHYVASPAGQTGDVTVRVDNAAPSISGAPTSSPNAAGWYNGPVTVHFTCSDAESGVASCEPDRTLASDGTGESVTGTATDNVGNTGTATVGGINIDQMPPTIGGAPTTAPTASGWYRGPVTVHFTCSDERSGIATCPADQTISTDGANQSVTGTAVDVAGNSTSFTVTGINIDNTGPVITGATTTPPNAAGWHKSSVVVHFTCADAASGVASCPADVTVNTDGIQNVTRSATDNAGNTSSATVTVKFDKTPATSAFNGSGTIIVLPGGPISGTATDNLSGIANVMVTFKASIGGATQTKQATLAGCTATMCNWTVSAPTAIGFYTATSIATDVAGNVQNPGTARTVQVIS